MEHERMHLDHDEAPEHHTTRYDLQQQLKARFEAIIYKYERDFAGIGDEVDLRTGQIVVDNGHLVGMHNEADVTTTVCLNEGSGTPQLSPGHQSELETDSHSEFVSQVDLYSGGHGQGVESLIGDKYDHCKRDEDPLQEIEQRRQIVADGSYADTGRALDPLWCAPNIPGLQPIQATFQALSVTPARELRRSTSPEVSIWDLQQSEYGSGYVKKRYETPWNDQTDSLLTQLRLTTKKSYAELQRFFPGRCASTIRAHWLSLQCHQMRGDHCDKQIQPLESVLTQQDTLDTGSTGNGDSSPQISLEQSGENGASLCTRGTSDVEASLLPEDHPHRPTALLDSVSKEERPYLFSHYWAECQNEHSWNPEQEIILRRLHDDECEFPSFMEGEFDRETESIIAKLQPMVDPIGWETSCHGHLFRCKVEARLVLIHKEVQRTSTRSLSNEVLTPDRPSRPYGHYPPNSSILQPVAALVSPERIYESHEKRAPTPQCSSPLSRPSRRSLSLRFTGSDGAGTSSFGKPNSAMAQRATLLPSMAVPEPRQINEKARVPRGAKRKSITIADPGYDETILSDRPKLLSSDVSRPSPSIFPCPTTRSKLRQSAHNIRPIQSTVSMSPPTKRPRTEKITSTLSFMTMLSDDSEDELARPPQVTMIHRTSKHTFPRKKVAAINRWPMCSLSGPICQRKFCVRCSLEDDELAAPSFDMSLKRTPL